MAEESSFEGREVSAGSGMLNRKWKWDSCSGSVFFWNLGKARTRIIISNSWNFTIDRALEIHQDHPPSGY